MEISLAAEPIFHIGPFVVTNSLLAGWVVTLGFAALAFVFTRRRLTPVPSGLQNLSEAIADNTLQFIEGITGDRHKAQRFFPLVVTIFFFVLFSNWFGLLPGVGSIGIYEIIHGKTVLVPFLRSASADLNGTLAIALASVLGTQIFAILAVGFFKHAVKYLNVRSPIMFFVGLLEMVSELARVVSFSFRLFGNIFAGEVLLIVVMALVPFFIPLPFIFMEIFVGIVQALVFALLTLVFLTIATVEHNAH